MSEQRFAGQRICITGVAGFIGSHLAERLLALGAEVAGIDNFIDFYEPAVKRENLAATLRDPRFTLVEGDIRDARALAEALVGCQLVVHLAAMPGVRRSLEQPLLYQAINVGGTLQLLEAMRMARVPSLVFASSSSVYGNNRKVPFAEEDPVDHPISIYAASKKAGELLCHTYHAVYGLAVTCLRFFTVYGPRQRPDLAIHMFARRIEAEQPVPFFGDGSMERDYTYIEDTLSGVLAAIASCSGNGFRLINLGSDRPVRLDVLLEALERALGKQAKREVRWSVPPCEVQRTWADLTRAQALLGYAPQWSLEQGLAEFVRWLRRERG